MMIWKSAVCLPWDKVSCLITSVCRQSMVTFWTHLARQLCITIDSNWGLRTTLEAAPVSTVGQNYIDLHFGYRGQTHFVVSFWHCRPFWPVSWCSSTLNMLHKITVERASLHLFSDFRALWYGSSRSHHLRSRRTYLEGSSRSDNLRLFLALQRRAREPMSTFFLDRLTSISRSASYWGCCCHTLMTRL